MNQRGISASVSKDDAIAEYGGEKLGFPKDINEPGGDSLLDSGVGKDRFFPINRSFVWSNGEVDGSEPIFISGTGNFNVDGVIAGVYARDGFRVGLSIKTEEDRVVSESSGYGWEVVLAVKNNGWSTEGNSADAARSWAFKSSEVDRFILKSVVSGSVLNR